MLNIQIRTDKTRNAYYRSHLRIRIQPGMSMRIFLINNKGFQLNIVIIFMVFFNLCNCLYFLNLDMPVRTLVVLINKLKK